MFAFAASSAPVKALPGGDLAPLGLPLKIAITVTRQIFTEHYPPASRWVGQGLNLWEFNISMGLESERSWEMSERKPN